jgi:bacteriocin biosynthesis cyclodehydratase domain-containing protein
MPTTCVVAVDSFGVAVGRRLVARLPDTVLLPRQFDRPIPAGYLPLADAYVLVAARQVEDLCQWLDDSVHVWRRKLLPVVVEHPWLRVGPLVAPGSGACATCYLRRFRQHHRSLPQWEALVTHYRVHTTDGPRGYLPSTVFLAAELAAQQLSEAFTGDNSGAGTVRHLHLLGHQMRRSTVIGIHGCPRCGSGRQEPERSYARLAEVLQPVIDAQEVDNGVAIGN